MLVTGWLYLGLPSIPFWIGFVCCSNLQKCWLWCRIGQWVQTERGIRLVWQNDVAFPPSPGTPLARDGHGFHRLGVLRTWLYWVFVAASLQRHDGLHHWLLKISLTFNPFSPSQRLRAGVASPNSLSLPRSFQGWAPIQGSVMRLPATGNLISTQKTLIILEILKIFRVVC